MSVHICGFIPIMDCAIFYTLRRVSFFRVLRPSFAPRSVVYCQQRYPSPVSTFRRVSTASLGNAGPHDSRRSISNHGVTRPFDPIEYNRRVPSHLLAEFAMVLAMSPCVLSVHIRSTLSWIILQMCTPLNKLCTVSLSHSTHICHYPAFPTSLCRSEAVSGCFTRGQFYV